MNFIKIKGKIRKNIGKKSSIFLRKNGKIPCVVYNKDINILFYTSVSEIEKIIYTSYVNIIIIFLKKKKINSIIRYIQFSPVDNNILHVDFYKYYPNKPLTLDIPLTPLGKPQGVIKGGIYNSPFKKIKIKTLPINLPKNIEFDISKLEIGDKICVKDIRNNKYIILHPDNTVISTIAPSKIDLEISKKEENKKEENKKEENKKEENKKEENKKEENKKEENKKEIKKKKIKKK